MTVTTQLIIAFIVLAILIIIYCAFVTKDDKAEDIKNMIDANEKERDE